MVTVVSDRPFTFQRFSGRLSASLLGTLRLLQALSLIRSSDFWSAEIRGKALPVTNAASAGIASQFRSAARLASSAHPAMRRRRFYGLRRFAAISFFRFLTDSGLSLFPNASGHSSCTIASSCRSWSMRRTSRSRRRSPEVGSSKIFA